VSDVYLLLTALVILGSLAVSFRRTRDPMSPLVIFAPMLFYVYVYHPYMILARGEVSLFSLAPRTSITYYWSAWRASLLFVWVRAIFDVLPAMNRSCEFWNRTPVSPSVVDFSRSRWFSEH
jgi:hypothetical protein